MFLLHLMVMNNILDVMYARVIRARDVCDTRVLDVYVNVRVRVRDCSSFVDYFDFTSSVDNSAPRLLCTRAPFHYQ